MATLSEIFKSDFAWSRKKTVHIVLLVAAFFLSFIFFLYMTFPYGVLKEAISAEVNKATGMNIRVARLGPNLPAGVDFEGVQIEATPGGKAFNIDQVYAGVGFFSLLITRLSADVDLTAKDGGTLSIGISDWLFRLISGGDSLPRELTVNAEKFPLDELVSFALGAAANSPDVSPLLAPMLSKLLFRGKLNGVVDMNFENDARESEGEFDIKINDGLFIIDDPSLNIADQRFEKAVLKGKLNKGEIKLDDGSGFKTQELEVSIKGGISLRESLPKSVLGIKIALKLDRGLKEQFGFLINTAGGQDAAVAWNITGSLGAPSYALVPYGE